MGQTPVAQDVIFPQRSRYLQRQAPLDALALAVAGMHRSFCEHKRRQEGCGGYFAFLITASPSFMTILAHLRAQHHQLVGALAALRVKIRRSDESHWEALLAEADAITAAIAEHDALESELLEQALFG